jgi:hypothetical protein
MKIYTILAIHFAYNDNYSYSDEGAGRPIKAYRSEEKANEDCNELNRQNMIEANPGEFAWNGYAWVPEQLPELREITGLSETELTDVCQVVDHWDDFSDEAKLKLWDIARETEKEFFSVHEIEVEDCQVRESTR